MLKVLVVDDDKLARRGIIAVMPWATFDMEVVGEANNGETALEFMRENEVDLLITDLAMPVMSGLDLIRQAQRLYPQVWFVVLTFHQEFDLIQEALRLGAIDYIAKTQIEQARMEDVLGRINERIVRQPQSSVVALMDERVRQWEDFDTVLVFMAMSDGIHPQSLKQLSFIELNLLQEMSLGIWSVPVNQDTIDSNEIEAELGKLGLDRHMMVLRLGNSDRLEWDLVRRKVLVFKERAAFYEFRADQLVYHFSIQQLDNEYSGWGDQELRHYRKEWSSLLWTVQADVYQSLLQELIKARASVAQLESVFYAAQLSWNRIIPNGSLDRLGMPGIHSNWSDWVDWLNEVRSHLGSCVQKQNYSNEITKSILMAVDYIHKNLGDEIKHSDLARAVNMSKGYFSLCFKGIIGKPFQDYIRDIRIEKAKLLLEQTSYSIFRIAELCGYPNEKYFSRVFLKHSGMLPSKYRQATSKGLK